MIELNYQYLDVLIKRTVDGDSDSFAELYAATYERQYQFAYYFLKDIYLAQDAIQQVYSYTLEHLGTVRDTPRIIQWIDQINYRICYKILYQEPSSQTAKLIWNLPCHESAVFIMYTYQSMSVRDISLALGESKQVVTHLFRQAQKKLQKHNIPTEALQKTVRLKPSRMDTKSADILLDNVLEQCGYAPHGLSVSAIVTSHLFRRENYALQKVLAGLTLCVLLLLPLLFVIPSAKVSSALDTNNGRLIYNVKVSSLLRVKSVSAEINGQPVPVYETAKKVYTIEPDTPGSASVTITLENGQYNTESFKVDTNRS
ncbi:MAG: hypothetical protein PHN80_01530 [Hespellia sp.]|nr:hypothetical protein [Hespellia sp.]